MSDEKLKNTNDAEIMRGLNFTFLDVQNNRNGELSEKQRQQLGRDEGTHSAFEGCLTIPVIFGIVIAICFMVAVLPAMFWDERAKTVKDSLGWIALVVVIIVGFIMTMRPSRKAARVDVVIGALEVGTDVTQIPQTTCWIQIGRQQFDVPFHMLDELKIHENENTAIYYAAHSGQFLSLEFTDEKPKKKPA